MQQIRCVIFGANGFMGRALLNYLSDTGEFEILAPPRTELNIVEKEMVARYIAEAQPAVIVNLAGISSVIREEEQNYYKINAIAHANILEAALTVVGKVRVYLASSAQIYGKQSRMAISENSAFAPINHYGLSKVIAERFTQAYSDKLVTTIVRPFNCIGRGQPSHFLIPKIIDHFREKQPTIRLGYDVERDFIDIRDICQMWRLIIQADAPPAVVNFSNGEAVPVSSIIALLTTLTGHQISVEQSTELMRPQDLLYQCGDNGVIRGHGYQRQYELHETLKWMLTAG